MGRLACCWRRGDLAWGAAAKPASDVAARPGTRLRSQAQQGQVDTPDEIVRFTWEQIRRRRAHVRSVHDLGRARHVRSNDVTGTRCWARATARGPKSLVRPPEREGLPTHDAT